MKLPLHVRRFIAAKTQLEIELVTGISKSQYSLMERGYANISVCDRQAIAAAINCSVNDIEWPKQRFSKRGRHFRKDDVDSMGS